MKLSYCLFFVLLGNNFSICNVEGLRAEKVLGGSLVITGRHKYMVAVIYKPDNESFINPCAGAILNKFHIITVAHCFYNKQLQQFIEGVFYIALSAYDLQKPSYSTQYIQIDYVVVPDDYDFNNPDIYKTKGDLAILKLSESLDSINQTLDSLEIAKGSIKSFNVRFRVSGYGWNTVTTQNSTDEFSISGRTDGKLRTIKIHLLSPTECKNVMGGNLASGYMCGRAIRRVPNQPSGICEGDSGAPLIHEKTSRIYGLAVTSFMKCDENEIPGVYILTLQYKIFIENVLRFVTTDDMLIFQLQKDSKGQYRFHNIPQLIKENF